MPNWKKIIVSGSDASLNSLYAPSITGSLLGTSSYAIYAETASLSTTSQDILIRVLNQSGNSISKGLVVHITASDNSSDIPRVITASYENDNNSANTLGIANETIANGAEGFVMTEGVLKGIDTSAFTSGQLIYLGATGSIIGTAPVAPLHAVRLGQVVRVQLNNGSIYVRIDNGYELDELHNVLINTSSVSYGDLLMYSSSLWINSKQLSGSYGLTGSLTISGSSTFTNIGPAVFSGSVISTGGFTGSLLGTATTASYVQTAQTASYVLQAVSASFATTASYYGGSVTSASYALTASYILQAVSASYAATSSYATQFKVATGLTASGLIYPSADNGNESYIQTDGAGNLSLQYVKSMYETVRNRETSSIIAGIPLFVSGATGANSDVYIADASNPARMPATYIASETIAPSGTGKALISGLLTNINTTAYQAGQEFFVNTGSGITTSRPPYPNSVQVLGIITRVGVNGQAVILNPGQIEIQNIQPGYVLVGNNIGTPTAVATASLSVASASFATTASYVLQAVSASYATQALSSSYALTSSYSDTSISASYALSASYAPSTPAFPYTGSAIISGSLESTGSFKIQGAGNGFTGPFTAIEVDDVNFSRKLFDFDTGSGSLDFGARQLLDRYGTTAIEWTGTSGTYLSNLYGAHRIGSGVRDKLYTNNDYSGQILLDVYFDVNVQDNDLVYLGNTGEWLQAEQNNSAATRMLGIAKEIFNQTGSVLIEGDIVVTTTGGYPVVSNAGYGSPVYIKEGTGTQMDTTVPVTGYVRLLGYCYASYNAGNEWIMKFRPSNEWVEL